MRATRSPRSVSALILAVAATACAGADDVDLRPGEDPGADEAAAETAAVPSEPSEELLCDVIDDDEALTPAGAEPIEIPGVEEANSERRCMFAFGVDMSTEEIRNFYRSTLVDRGFEIDQFVEGDGIARGNLSRTLIRAAKPDMQVNLTVDGFDPDETSMAEYEIQARVQIDRMGG